MDPRQTSATLEAFHHWARVRLRDYPEIREDGQDTAVVAGSELYELLRSACEHGYECGFSDGHDSGQDDAASFFRPRGKN
jgi:hypothetical protein